MDAGGSVLVSSLPRVKSARGQQQLRRHSLLGGRELCRALERPESARSLAWFRYYRGCYDVRRLQEDSVSRGPLYVSSGRARGAFPRGSAVSSRFPLRLMDARSAALIQSAPR